MISRTSISIRLDDGAPQSGRSAAGTLPTDEMRSNLGYMAKKTTVVLVDDLNGDPADTTIRFGLDSREYELDLTDGNAQELRDLIDR